MRRGLVGLGLALAVAAAVPAAAGGAGAGGRVASGVTIRQSGGAATFVPGEVIVGFRPSTDPLTRRLAVADQSAATVQSVPQLDVQVVKVDGSVPDAIAAFRSNPAVAYAEPNWISHADAVPNDPRYTQEYGLAKIQAPQAWDVTTGSAAVTVAVVDTGVASDHPDLQPNMVAGDDLVQGDLDPRDFNGHGTHVAGTIGAVGNNGLGVTGVDWHVHLMPVRVLNGSGSGSDSTIAQGFLWACQHGAQIVNASLGGSGYSTPERNAIADPSCANTLFVVAAGNDGANNDVTPHYPCNFGGPPDNLPNVLCVAATDANDNLASF
jgi:thermitase